MNEIPLMWTTEGNLPCKDVKRVAQWHENETTVVLHLLHFLQWDHECKALIKKDVHVMLKRGLVLGGEQSQL